MKHQTLTLTILLLSIACPISYADSPVRRIDREIPYKTDAAEYELERCRLDLYTPLGRGDSFPTVLWLHGGGLTTGDKAGEISRNFAEKLTLHGIAVASANYRLSPRATYPAYIEDASAALAWLHKNVQPRNGDPNKLFIAGHSAGAYLSAMVALDPRYLRRHGLDPTFLCGVIPVSPQVDSHWTVRDERGIHRSIRVIDESAPLFHVRRDAPPMLDLCGDNDLAGRAERNTVFADAMKAAGHKDMTYRIIPGRNHNTLISRSMEDRDGVAEAIIDFIRKHAP